MQLLKDRGIDPHIIEYLKNPPSVSDIRNLSKKLGLHPKEFIRTREPDFKEQKLADNLDVLLVHRNYDLGFDNPYQKSFSEYPRYKSSIFEWFNTCE